MKFKIKSLLIVSLSISMLLLSGCGNDTSNNVSDTLTTQIQLITLQLTILQIIILITLLLLLMKNTIHI